MENPDIPQMLAEYLRSNGYDGLVLPGECGCLLGDLMPCGEPGDCVAGYKGFSDDPDHGGWAMFIEKPKDKDGGG